MTLPTLALRNALRRRRRYAPAAFNLAVFALTFTVLTGAGDSFLGNLGSRAAAYYGGQGTLLTYRLSPGSWDDQARDPAEVRALLSSLPWVKGVGLRHVYRQPGTKVFAFGSGVPLRLVTGVDPAESASSPYDLSEGVAVLGPGDILLPRSVARALGVRLGDDATLWMTTYTGQRNTVNLRVTGIYRDDPVFGRGVAFVDRQALNRWSGKAVGYGSEDALVTDGPLTDHRAAEVTAVLARTWALWSHPADKKAFLARYPTESWEGPKSVVFTLGDHTRDLAVALEALRVGLALTALLVLVAAALGLGGTLKILLNERIREVGTLRALGMGRDRVFRLLLVEVELVAASAALVGSAAGYGALILLSSVSWEGIPLVQPLLIRGTLGYSGSVVPGLVALAWTGVAVFVASAGPLGRSSRARPAQALEGRD